jgi:hypothetical protein
MEYRHLLMIFMLMLPCAFVYCGGTGDGQTSRGVVEPPYPPSPVIENITWDFDNLTREAPGSDLWPVTWGADDNLYASWGDGVGFGAIDFDEQWGPDRTSLGFSRIEGSPTNFKGINIWGGKDTENPATFEGKSAGILSVDGVLYAWINTQNGSPADFKLAWSSDLGASWQLSSWIFSSSGTFFPSTFLNFGRDYFGARDGFLYFYGGNWGHTRNVYMGRVPKDKINDRAAYEFLSGFDAKGKPVWTSDISKRQPVFTDPNLADEFNGALKASVIYNPGIGRYILTVPHGGVGKLGIFDAPEHWGPWTTVAYHENWGGFGTNVSGEGLLYVFPTKWISSDGKTMWCIFSGRGEFDSFNLIRATLAVKTP